MGLVKKKRKKDVTNGEFGSDDREGSHLPSYVPGEVAVRGELEMATVSCGVVHHIDLSGLVVQKQVYIETYIV